ncbi:unnamed protein product [[Candida] boidinii]|nr:unnamed protein product [[Candida] boidinii]
MNTFDAEDDDDDDFDDNDPISVELRREINSKSSRYSTDPSSATIQTSQLLDSMNLRKSSHGHQYSESLPGNKNSISTIDSAGSTNNNNNNNNNNNSHHHSNTYSGINTPAFDMNGQDTYDTKKEFTQKLLEYFLATGDGNANNGGSSL